MDNPSGWRSLNKHRLRILLRSGITTGSIRFPTKGSGSIGWKTTGSCTIGWKMIGSGSTGSETTGSGSIGWKMTDSGSTGNKKMGYGTIGWNTTGSGSTGSKTTGRGSGSMTLSKFWDSIAGRSSSCISTPMKSFQRDVVDQFVNLVAQARVAQLVPSLVGQSQLVVVYSVVGGKFEGAEQQVHLQQVCFRYLLVSIIWFLLK